MGGPRFGKPDDKILEHSLIIVLVTCITLTKVKDKLGLSCVWALFDNKISSVNGHGELK